MVGVISDEITEVRANVGYLLLSESSSSMQVYEIEIHNQYKIPAVSLCKFGTFMMFRTMHTHWRCSIKKGVATFRIIHRKTPVLGSLFN